MKRVSPRWYEWSRYSPALRLDELRWTPAEGMRLLGTRFGKRYRFRLPEERDIAYWEGVPTD